MRRPGCLIGCNGFNVQSGGAEPAGSGLVLGARWKATEEWNLTTGYGTPNFQKLKALVLGLEGSVSPAYPDLLITRLSQARSLTRPHVTPRKYPGS